jgi:hypothetical protein
MASKASNTKTGIAPSFSPREMVYEWERMPENVRSRFEPDEVAMLDAMLTQKPGVMTKAIQTVLEFAKSKGLKGLSFHPTARFYEPAPRVIGPQAASKGAVSGVTQEGRKEDKNAKAKALSQQFRGK